MSLKHEPASYLRSVESDLAVWKPGGGEKSRGFLSRKLLDALYYSPA